jgi:hypothetical protein
VLGVSDVAVPRLPKDVADDCIEFNCPPLLFICEGILIELAFVDKVCGVPNDGPEFLPIFIPVPPKLPKLPLF